MNIPGWVWLATLVITIGVLVVDVVVIGRRPHEPSMKECGRYLAVYISGAVLFGTGVLVFSGPRYGGEFFAGWLTEYSLSVDNLFIFIIIMSKFAVPRQYQQTALMVGIVMALIMRGIFIALGAAAINQFSWIFYVFGAFLIYTAIKLAQEGQVEEEEYEENRFIKTVERRFPATDGYRGVKLLVRENGRRLMTPMLIVMLALGTTDLLFAVDSIPAIYGLTREPYLVLTANIFALMGLRQLYFLLGGLLQRLVYLSYGLSVLLLFIGVKLVLHAMHENELPFINGGEHVEWAPEIPIWLSLTTIVGILGVTAVLSLLKTHRDNHGDAPAEPPAGEPDAEPTAGEANRAGP
ncbi:MAG: TerC/Alx family metal homeostasis membrane protein [Propionibacteriales bacterium]|nr:TerC/Alx family metal homeostasis membrane protein [Propionibacteriales bacterium]